MEYSSFKIFSQKDENFIKTTSLSHTVIMQMELAKFGYRSDRN
jgi:hypothetical protein